MAANDKVGSDFTPRGDKTTGSINVNLVDALTSSSMAGENTSSVASSAAVVTVLAANTDRLSYSVFNDSTEALYLKHGAGASVTDYKVKIAADGFYEMPAVPLYLGIVTGIWASANGSAKVSEGV